MQKEDIEQLAKALYEASTIVAPRWEQLGDTTKAYWRDRVLMNSWKDLI